MNKHLAAVAGTLALASALADPAQAQTPAQASTRPMSEEEAALLREEVALLKARVEQLEKRLAASDAAAATSAPTAPPAAAVAAAAPSATPAAAEKPPLKVDWKGSPRVTQGDRSFKVKGRIQADANYVSTPDGLDDKGLGFSNEFRRIRLGGEGKLGSGFGYKLELELSDNSVDLVDTFVTYEKGPWLLTLGNHNAFQSLDELTGDTSGSVMERAAFTDAFGFERRLGLSAQYRKGPLLAQLGVFTDDIGALANDSDGPAGGDENDSFSIDGRLVYAPKLGETQLHFGASGHWRKLGRVAADPIRYRQRPFVHSSNSRLIGTPELNVREESSQGLEFAAIRGRWHAVAESHWLRASRLNAAPAHFWGGYAEVGYFLTEGDSRAYDNGIFGAARPQRPLGDGGIGAVQLNLRYDYLDLNDVDIRGGTQNGYIAALVWTPIQYLRFNLNYAYLRYTGARALADGQTDYGLHVLGSRFELDF